MGARLHTVLHELRSPQGAGHPGHLHVGQHGMAHGEWLWYPCYIPTDPAWRQHLGLPAMVEAGFPNLSARPPNYGLRDHLAWRAQGGATWDYVTGVPVLQHGQSPLPPPPAPTPPPGPRAKFPAGCDPKEGRAESSFDPQRSQEATQLPRKQQRLPLTTDSSTRSCPRRAIRPPYPHSPLLLPDLPWPQIALLERPSSRRRGRSMGYQ